MSCLVFIPGLGFEHNGARRWLSILGMSFQPAEFLKFAFVLYFATLLSSLKPKLNNWKFSILPVLILLAVLSILAYLQPDYGTFVVIAMIAMVMLFVSGIRLKHFFTAVLIMLISAIPIVILKPYIWQRLLTFFNREGT